jgi:hypothetical protein
LAQSQTASPDGPATPSYFPELPVNVKAATTSVTPMPEPTQRPPMADRATSTISTTDSVKTIRAPQPSHRPSILNHQDSVKSTLNGVSSTISTFWEGASNRLPGKRGRDRSTAGDSRSSSISRKSSDSDHHTRPSIAVSTLNASGDLATPERLRTNSSRTDTRSPTQLTRPVRARQQSLMPPTSSEAAFQEAHELNQRKQIHEINQHDPDDRFRMPENQAEDECPPSPDDLTFIQEMTRPQSDQRRATSSTELQDSRGSPIQTLPSASTIASSTGDPFSYSSNVSQRISNPSLGFGSGASSPPGDPYISAEKESYPAYGADHEAEYMRTAEYMHTAELISPRGHRTTPPATAGKPLEQQAAYDDADDDLVEDCDDDDSSDDEGGIMMASSICRK